MANSISTHFIFEGNTYYTTCNAPDNDSAFIYNADQLLVFMVLDYTGANFDTIFTIYLNDTLVYDPYDKLSQTVTQGGLGGTINSGSGNAIMFGGHGVT